MGSTKPFVIALAALGLAAASLPALADDPKPAAPKPDTAAPAAPPVAAPDLPDAAPVPAPAPKPVARLKPPKPELPVEISIDAVSPDPPWKFRIHNTGERPIRVPADVRLLSLEISHKTTKGAKRSFRCKAPSGMRAASFPQKRELYLDPGQVYEEAFDPRLLCFGAAADALAGGTKVEPVFGWAGGVWGTKGPYAAQGVDRPEEHQARRNVKAASFELPGTDPALVKPTTHFAMPAMEREGAEERAAARDLRPALRRGELAS